MIVGGLVIGSQIALRVVVLLQFVRHLDVLILLDRQLRTRGKEITTVLQHLTQMGAPLIGVMYIVYHRIISGFTDKVLKQIMVRLGYMNGF